MVNSRSENIMHEQRIFKTRKIDLTVTHFSLIP